METKIIIWLLILWVCTITLWIMYKKDMTKTDRFVSSLETIPFMLSVGISVGMTIIYLIFSIS